MSKSVDIPTQLLIDHGAVKRMFETEISAWMENKKIAVISGNGQTRQVTEKILQEFQRREIQCQVFHCKDNTLDTINQIEREVLESSANFMIGIGGGKVLDVSKVVGTRITAPVILIPTAISSDAICSPVAVIRMNKSTSIGVQMPQAVVIDLDILSSSPKRLVTAGYGDLISNKTALFDWNLAHQKQEDVMNTFASLMANNAVESFMNSLNREEDSPCFLMKVAAESLIMSGIAMSIAGSSRPCSGSEHLISHALDYYCGAKALHGEQVAIGMLVSKYLQNQKDGLEEIKQIYQRLGLPTHYAELGYTKADMKLAITMAPDMRKRYTILNEYQLNEKQIDQLLEEVFPSNQMQLLDSRTG